MAAIMYKYYYDKGTIIHKLSPIAKFFWFAVVALAVTVFNTWDFTLAILVYTILIALTAKFPWKKFRFSIAFIFLFMAICVFLWPNFVPGNIIFRWENPLFTWVLTDKGLSTALGIGFRVATMVIACFTLFSTTSQEEFLDGLRSLKIPNSIVTGVMLALRFAPTLAGEIGRIKEAQKARAFNPHMGPIKRRIKAYVEGNLSLIIPAINRIFKSTSDLTLCLDAKGFDFSKEYPRQEIILRKADKIFILLNSILLIISIVLRVLGYGFVPMY